MRKVALHPEEGGDPALNLQSAIAFVEEGGSDLEKARLRHILYGERPGPDLLQPFIRLQNADGDFPFGMQTGNISTLNNTHVALYTLDELGWLEASAADRAFKYLFAIQKDDGGWDETPAAAPLGPPSWATPGNSNARHYLTALSAFWLGVRGYRSAAAFQKALDFLLQHRQENGRFYGFLHTTWIAASALPRRECPAGSPSLPPAWLSLSAGKPRMAGGSPKTAKPARRRPRWGC